MDIYQISEQFRISIGKLSRMRKAGVLNVSSDDPHVGKIRSYIGRKRPIPVLELLHLINHPATLLELGDRAGPAEDALDALELADDYRAPAAIVSTIDQAAKDESDAVERLAEWMQETIPAGRKVNYSYLAIRLLINSPDAIASYNAPRIAQAFLNVRKLESFADGGASTLSPGKSKHDISGRIIKRLTFERT